MFSSAIIFLREITGKSIRLIMISFLARCIAMVIVWNELPKGDTEYTAGLVAFNSIFQVLFYSVYVGFFSDVAARFWFQGQISGNQHGTNCAKCLYLPRYPVCRRNAHALFLIKVKGKKLVSESVFRAFPLTTRSSVVMFSLKGNLIVHLPFDVFRIAVPLLIYFVVMFLRSFFMGKHSQIIQRRHVFHYRGK